MFFPGSRHGFYSTLAVFFVKNMGAVGGSAATLEVTMSERSRRACLNWLDGREARWVSEDCPLLSKFWLFHLILLRLLWGSICIL